MLEHVSRNPYKAHHKCGLWAEKNSTAGVLILLLVKCLYIIIVKNEIYANFKNLKKFTIAFGNCVIFQ